MAQREIAATTSENEGGNGRSPRTTSLIRRRNRLLAAILQWTTFWKSVTGSVALRRIGLLFLSVCPNEIRSREPEANPRHFTPPNFHSDDVLSYLFHCCIRHCDKAAATSDGVLHSQRHLEDELKMHTPSGLIKAHIEAHTKRINKQYESIYKVRLTTKHGSGVAPTAPVRGGEVDLVQLCVWTEIEQPIDTRRLG
jgi:hypothetical protein